MPKYKSAWKNNDLNKDFWCEVLLGRKIVSYVPTLITNARIAGNPEKLPSVMVLDSQEKVWLSEVAKIYDPLPGRTITALEWYDEDRSSGISKLLLDGGVFAQGGSWIMLPAYTWGLCIR